MSTKRLRLPDEHRSGRWACRRGNCKQVPVYSVAVWHFKKDGAWRRVRVRYCPKHVPAAMKSVLR